MVISSQEHSYEVIRVLPAEGDVNHYLGRNEEAWDVHLILMGQSDALKAFYPFLSEMEGNAAFTDLIEYFLLDSVLWMVFSWKQGQTLAEYLKEPHAAAERFDMARRLMEQLILKMVPVCLQREVLTPERVIVGVDKSLGFYYSFAGWREYGQVRAAGGDDGSVLLEESAARPLCALLKGFFLAEEESGLYPEWSEWLTAAETREQAEVLDIYQEYVKQTPVFTVEREKKKKPGFKDRIKKHLPRILAAVKIIAGITVMAAAFMGAVSMWREKVAPVIEAASMWKAVYVDGETLKPDEEETVRESEETETVPETDPDNGRGERYREDGSLCYKGGLKDGLYDDTGTLYYPDGTIAYQGGFSFGKKEGEGCQYTDTGSIFYEGEFKKDQFEGIGKLYDADLGNLVYEGGFSGGRYDGEGVLYDAATELPVYVGGFRLGKYDGRGLQYDGGGSLLYEGEFLLGNYHGEGVIYDPLTGVVLLEGIFRNNVYIGPKADDGDGELSGRDETQSETESGEAPDGEAMEEPDSFGPGISEEPQPETTDSGEIGPGIPKADTERETAPEEETYQ